ncbi:MAG: energy-coupling factor transporter transmembrane protein EcfT, partial [Deltaproteobacteria bacterium]|nr:energy-coupling factor transporter transmembrane protein EcfT [Deltaproteobacteria bacterium]
MDRINPGYKFLTILIVGAILSFTFKIWVNLGVFLIAILLTLSARNLDYKKLLAFLSLFALAAFGFFMTGLLFADTSQANDHSELKNFGIVTISVTSVDTALKLSSRILAYGALAALFTLTTKPAEFFHSLGQQFKVPPKFTYGILAAYGFLPTIKNEYELVKAAISVRGVKAGPFSTRRLFPMLVRAFRRSENLAMGMESRGFNPKAKRGQAFMVNVR